MNPRAATKRLRSAARAEDAAVEPPKKKGRKAAAVTSAPPRKPTLFDEIDASSSHQSSKSARDVLDELDGDGNNDESSPSSLSDEDEDEDEDLEFEDVPHHVAEPQANAPPAGLQDLDMTIVVDTRISLTHSLGKKGPTKRERAVRTACHRVHVMCLLWHNAVRNCWLCDQEVQALLLSHLTPRLCDEVDRWRRNSGLEVQAEPVNDKKSRGKGKQAASCRSKDWGAAAKKLEEGEMNMAHGDPIFRLMRALTMFWKQRFRVTAPGIRKMGYMSLERLDNITKAHAKEPNDANLFGERILSLQDFRKCAQECTGSRDVGAQLFTALLRALGLEARMIASLQPLGFGWTKAEEADPEKEDGTHKTPRKTEPAPSKKPAITPLRRKQSIKQAIDIESDEYTDENGDSDDSLIELPSVYQQRSGKSSAASKAYDKSLEFPHYWTEVLSPATKKYLPVDPLVKFVVATNRELVESFEPRGAKADRAKQVIAYVVGYSPDGSAKDVTLRYLKRQVMPGRSKGMRTPVEKIPVYNRHGKIKRYEQFDWFKYVMQGYERGGSNPKFPITEVDMLEDSTDLRPKQPEKKEPREGLETLQYYKTSNEFVLERHLKREEALLANSDPVKVFTTKGKGVKNEENVFLRKDVVPVKSAETWHKQGRAPKAGEQPLKRVPYRAATINRRLAIEEMEKETGQKVLQGLYSFEQTDWIIPPPIKDGKIPKNEYGNIDLFVEHMLPEGAVHVPYRRAMPVCKRLGIDFAEAVVDFDFGNRMAAPVIQGVVVAEEHHDKVMQELARDEAERTRKADEKRSKVALDMWRKFYRAMRIAERLRRQYGDVGEVEEVFRHHHEVVSGGAGGATEPEPEALLDDDGGGGFLPEGFDVSDEEPEQEPVPRRSSYFPSRSGDGDNDDDSDVGLVVEDGGSRVAATTTTTIADTSSGDTETPRSHDESRSNSSPPLRAPPTRRQRGGRAHQGGRTQRAKSRPAVVVEDSEESDIGDEEDTTEDDDSNEYVE